MKDMNDFFTFKIERIYVRRDNILAGFSRYFDLGSDQFFEISNKMYKLYFSFYISCLYRACLAETHFFY